VIFSTLPRLVSQAFPLLRLPKTGYPGLASYRLHLLMLDFNAAFAEGMKDLGYVDGRNIQIDWRLASGKVELLPAMAIDLVASRPAVIVATAPVGGLAVKTATSTIPTVVLAAHGGVSLGLYQSLAHPGGNVTGVDSWSDELDPKRVTILKDIVPNLSRLTVLFNPNDPAAPAHHDNIRKAVTSLGLRIEPVAVNNLSDFDAVFERMGSDPPQAIIVFLDPVFTTARKRLVDFALEKKVPMIGEDQGWVKLGQLISYGATLESIWYRGAYYVDRILKGARPADLPVELPTVIKLTVNLKTARLFGLELPPVILAAADETVE